MRLEQEAQKQQRPRCPNRKMYFEIRRADDGDFGYFVQCKVPSLWKIIFYGRFLDCIETITYHHFYVVNRTLRGIDPISSQLYKRHDVPYERPSLNKGRSKMTQFP